MSVSFSNLLTPNNYPVNQRAVIDNNFVQVINLNTMANANTINTNTIDLMQATPYPTTEIINVQVAIGTCANGLGPTNSANINCCLQVSSDNSNWANSALYFNPLLSITASNGSITGNTANIKLAPGEVRYIRAQFKGEASGGTPNNALTGTLQLLF